MPTKEIMIVLAVLALGYYLGTKGLLSNFLPG